MPDLPRCHLCGATREPDGQPLRRATRPLFESISAEPDRVPAPGEDPLGLRSVTIALCAPCATCLPAAPVLSRDDLAALKRLFELERVTAAEGAEAQRRRVVAMHRAMRLGLAEAARLAEERPRELAAVEPAQPDLFSAKAHRVREVVASLEESNFETARAALDRVTARYHMPEAAPFLALVRQVERVLGDRADEPVRLVGAADEVTRWPAVDAGAVEMRNALARGLYRRAASLADGEALGAAIDGKPTGYFWLRAGDVANALRSLEVAVNRPEGFGAAAVCLGNALHRSGDGRRARSLYRQAFARDPAGAAALPIEDEPVSFLLRRAAAFYGLAPAAVWVPLVGWAEGVLPLGDDVDEQEPCADFHRALAAWRVAEDESALATMRRLAPRLAEATRVVGKGPAAGNCSLAGGADGTA